MCDRCICNCNRRKDEFTDIQIRRACASSFLWSGICLSHLPTTPYGRDPIVNCAIHPAVPVLLASTTQCRCNSTSVQIAGRATTSHCLQPTMCVYQLHQPIRFACVQCTAHAGIATPAPTRKMVPDAHFSFRCFMAVMLQFRPNNCVSVRPRRGSFTPLTSRPSTNALRAEQGAGMRQRRLTCTCALHGCSRHTPASRDGSKAQQQSHSLRRECTAGQCQVPQSLSVATACCLRMTTKVRQKVAREHCRTCSCSGTVDHLLSTAVPHRL